MKKNILLALFGAALMFAFVGCSPTETASSTNPASTTEASTEMATCADCGHEMEKSAMKDSHGKMLCVNCAEKHDGTHDADMIDCPCGKQIAKGDAIDVEGTMVCADCAEKMKGATPAEGGETSTEAGH